MKIYPHLLRSLAAAVLLSSGLLSAAESFMAPPGLTTTASGLQYVITQHGEGAKPRLKSDQVVLMNFSVKLADGKVVRESWDAKNPFPYIYGLGRRINGWNEALGLMRVGDKGTFILTPQLAFGKYGDNGVPPNSPVRLDIEIIDLKDNLAEQLEHTILEKGIEAGRAQLAQAKQSGFAGMYHNDRLLAREGRELMKKKKYAEALALLQWTADLYPQSALAQGLQGDVYRKQGEREKAVLSYAKALELNPQDGSAVVGLAQLFPPKLIVMEKGKWAHYRALVKLGVEAADRGDMQRAGLLTEILESAWSNIGDDLAKKSPERVKEMTQAKDDFAAAVKAGLASDAEAEKIHEAGTALLKQLREEA